MSNLWVRFQEAIAHRLFKWGIIDEYGWNIKRPNTIYIKRRNHDHPNVNLHKMQARERRKQI